MAKVSGSSSNKKMRPALTPEANEQQMISLTMDLVRQRLLDGTATAQETTHFLKLASRENQLKLEKLQRENELLTAKTKALEEQSEYKQIVEEAIKAMTLYKGQGEPDEY